MSWRTKCLLIPQLNILNKSQIPPVPAHNHKGCAGQGLNFTAGLPRKIRLPPARERGSFQYSYLVAESIEIPDGQSPHPTGIFKTNATKMPVFVRGWIFCR
jgi:hypothetical protein